MQIKAKEIFLLLLFIYLNNFDCSYITPKISVNALIQKIEMEQPPIFEFAKDCESLLDSASPLELQNIFCVYMNRLHDYYFVQFLNRLSNDKVDRNYCKVQKQVILTECTVAMKASIPSVLSKEWLYDVSTYSVLHKVF
jgi:hypothetical protein